MTILTSAGEPLRDVSEQPSADQSHHTTYQRLQQGKKVGPHPIKPMLRQSFNGHSQRIEGHPALQKVRQHAQRKNQGVKNNNMPMNKPTISLRSRK